MERVDTGNGSTDANENQDESRSPENFQKFMYELFEKNGVLNDLRSYLRGHIISVLRSAQTGQPLSCQKHFAQRLELPLQALNILIAEYLMHLEFNYSLSVFISEIPLANMVFSFAKTLMNKLDIDDRRPRFKDNDVWCILNYLGVKCDSEHVSNILEMYKVNQNTPLLLCIFKCVPLFQEYIGVINSNSSLESCSSNPKSSGSAEEKPVSPQPKTSFHQKCRHYMYCKTCHSKIMKIREKYRKKKKDIAMNSKKSSLSSLDVNYLMQNLSEMERRLIDEMFDQLKSVYEAEIELVKQEEEKRVKRSLATHSTQLQKRREEMEESFKAREIELEKNVQQKKMFLWGLARALREQHQHMARSMQDVRAENNRLSDKEESLKSQLAQAEEVLRARGEDMRQQITAELATLETHLGAMKRERDSIQRERRQLQLYKEHASTNIRADENEGLKSHYDLLTNELSTLKKYLEAAKLQPKCVLDGSTLTDLHDVTAKIDVILNNGQDIERRSEEDRAKPKQLVNDLKKQKNVNFIQPERDEPPVYREKSRSRSRSSASSEAGDATFVTDQRDTVQQLRDENEQLRSYAKQQRAQIARLSSQQALLQAELTASRVRTAPPAPPALRPRTAPTPAAPALDTHARMSASASVNNFSSGWRKGAGEELCFFSNAQPRIVVPGDAIPFVGVINRRTDNRRYLINQWRMLRRRMSPLGAGGGRVCKRTTSPVQRNLRETPEKAGPSVPSHQDEVDDSADVAQSNVAENEEYRPAEYRPLATDGRPREKSPKSVLREAKENLRNTVKSFPPSTGDKSLNGILREAKLRLRKLEIEAEAVEKSYLDFRRKQHAFRGERGLPGRVGDESAAADAVERDLDTIPSISRYKPNKTYTKGSTSQQPHPTKDYDKYYKEYETKLGGERFKNKNAVIINPIPNAYSTQEADKTDNYLETPLTEFRKLYRPRHSNEGLHTPESAKPTTAPSSDTTNTNKGTRHEIVRQAKHDKVKELELLKHNIMKIYNMPEQVLSETLNNESEINPTVEDTNLLRVEVESVSEINEIKVTESETQDMFLIVESSADNMKGIESDSELDYNVSTKMTITISPRNAADRVSLKDEPVLDRSGMQTPRNESSKSASKKESIKSLRKEIPESGKFISELAISDQMKTDGVVATDHSDIDVESNDTMQIHLSKEALDDIKLSELDPNDDLELDYPDDFSADVDNYNSRSEYENQSTSHPKTSEHENFWDT